MQVPVVQNDTTLSFLLVYNKQQLINTANKMQSLDIFSSCLNSTNFLLFEIINFVSIFKALRCCCIYVMQQTVKSCEYTCLAYIYYLKYFVRITNINQHPLMIVNLSILRIIYWLLIEIANSVMVLLFTCKQFMILNIEKSFFFDILIIKLIIYRNKYVKWILFTQRSKKFV